MHTMVMSQPRQGPVLQKVLPTTTMLLHMSCLMLSAATAPRPCKHHCCSNSIDLHVGQASGLRTETGKRFPFLVLGREESGAAPDKGQEKGLASVVSLGKYKAMFAWEGNAYEFS